MKQASNQHRPTSPHPVRLGNLSSQDLLQTLALDDSFTFITREEFPKGSIIFTAHFPNNRDVRIDLTNNDHEPELQDWWTLIGAVTEFIQQQTEAGTVQANLFGGIPFSAQSAFLDIVECELYPRMIAEKEAASFFARIPQDVARLSNNELFSMFCSINTSPFAHPDTLASLQHLKQKVHELVKARGLKVGDILRTVGHCYRLEKVTGELHNDDLYASLQRVEQTDDGTWLKVPDTYPSNYPIVNTIPLKHGGEKQVPPHVVIRAQSGRRDKGIIATLLAGVTYPQSVFSSTKRK